MTAGLPVGSAALLRAPATLMILPALLAWTGNAGAAKPSVDQIPPTISIQVPTEADTLVVSSPSLFVSGRANDNRRLARVTWRTDNGARGVASGSRNWSVNGIPLKAGTNQVIVEAFDRAGNSASDVLVVTYDPPPPPAPPPPPTNHKPTISGTPSTSVTVGDSYSFTPRAADADGDTLTFTINGAPDWASFDATNGRLSGNPGTADIGLTEGIVITVSDGTDYASLPAFSLAVVAGANGAAMVSWIPPTQRVDGSALTNLAGFRIRYGSSQTNLDRTIHLNNPGLTSYMVEQLVKGTWYFTVTALDSAGLESAPSNLASKTVY